MEVSSKDQNMAREKTGTLSILVTWRNFRRYKTWLLKYSLLVWKNTPSLACSTPQLTISEIGMILTIHWECHQSDQPVLLVVDLRASSFRSRMKPLQERKLLFYQLIGLNGKFSDLPLQIYGHPAQLIDWAVASVAEVSVSFDTLFEYLLGLMHSGN